MFSVLSSDIPEYVIPGITEYTKNNTTIITTFCGVSFGYGVSIFVGSMDIAVRDYTELASHLIDTNYHVPLSSNLIFIIFATIIITIVGTIIIEKLIAPKVGHYKREEEFAKTEQYRVINYEEEEQKKIERERNEKRGLKFALIISIVLIIMYIYSLIPGLPYSGMLLDNTEKIYLNQLFGDNSYFQDGFKYIFSVLSNNIPEYGNPGINEYIKNITTNIVITNA